MAEPLEQSLRLRVVRPKAQGFTGVGARVVLAAELRVGDREVELGARALRIEPDGLFQVRGSLGAAPGDCRANTSQLVDVGQGLPDLAAIWRFGMPALEPRDGFVETSLVDEAHGHLRLLFRSPVVE